MLSCSGSCWSTWLFQTCRCRKHGHRKQGCVAEPSWVQGASVIYQCPAEGSSPGLWPWACASDLHSRLWLRSQTVPPSWHTGVTDCSTLLAHWASAGTFPALLSVCSPSCCCGCFSLASQHRVLSERLFPVAKTKPVVAGVALAGGLWGLCAVCHCPRLWPRVPPALCHRPFWSRTRGPAANGRRGGPGRQGAAPARAPRCSRHSWLGYA